MKKLHLKYLFFFLFLMSLTIKLSAIDIKDTRMMSQPTISSSHVAFIYAEDLWVANIDGTHSRRLTVDAGVESNPCFSPDGKLIAFSAQYDGNTDVFVVPVEGGVPKRLTWHPGNDFVRGFSPDGKSVLFISQRDLFTNRYFQLFTVPVEGGFPQSLKIPNAFHASYSPDGKYMAYTPIPDRFLQWKNYRGGTVSEIWLFSFADNSVVKIPQPEGRSNDTQPMWIADKVYFLSDRNGEFNIYSYSPVTKEINQLTRFDDFPILNASAGNGRIVFDQAGFLHTFNPVQNTSEKLTVGIAADLLELRPRYAKGANYIRSAGISPSGARAVFGFRGEILTVPSEKGDPRNITLTTHANEKYPAWSPDGKSIAYFSDESGEYELHIKSQDGKGAARKFRLTGSGFYAYPIWSPNSEKIAFVDNARNLFMLDLISGSIKKIDSDDLYVPGPFRQMFGDWSHDSKWIAYTKVLGTHFSKIFLYSVAEGKSYPLTDGLSDAREPVFDKSGKYLYFFASTDAGPVINWFDQSSHDMRATNSIYLVTLQKSTISPLAKESDEEALKAEKKETPPAEEKVSKGKKDATVAQKPEGLKIDFENILDRIVDLPVRAGNYQQLGSHKEGEILYVVRSWDNPREGKMRKYDLNKRKDSEVMELDAYFLSADGKKMLFFRGGSWGICNAGEKSEPGKGMINTASLEVRIDPVSEWAQIYDEAWRVNRDYFYDPGMHGSDWKAMKEKYEQFLPHLTTRSDLNNVIQWLCSELGVGHHRVGGGDRLNPSRTIPGGLLGADYEVINNRYRLKKIYGGLNWNPELRSPLTEPGINAKVGEYILAVNGDEVTADKNLYQFFENTAGKILELTIGPNPNRTGSRTVQVVPVANEMALRNRDWVEGNLKFVHEATNGQVAYVYVPNTTTQGHEYFKRYFFPQANKKAIIIDERFNGGGLIADYYIDLLTRPYQSHWNMRYGMDMKTPNASIQGPKVMLINETAGSGGDMLPWMFRKFNVGPLVGKATWGGLVGTLGFPELMDGGMVTAPNLAIWTEEGFIVENVGVPPDVEVEMWPADVIQGKDPQLLKAIEIIMEELKKNPPKEYVRPPYPFRGWNVEKK
jgi:tricorn protease